jgi:hypothetical protein
MSRRWMAGGVVALLLLLALLWGWFSQPQSRVVRLAEVAGCQLHQQACRVTLPDGLQLSFEMSPRPLPTTAPITLRAQLSGGGAQRVEVLFEGRDMYMGFLQYRLKPQSDGVTFLGSGSLSICVRRLMEWLAVVRIARNGEWVEVPFAFETIHP